MALSIWVQRGADEVIRDRFDRPRLRMLSDITPACRIKPLFDLGKYTPGPIGAD